MPKKLNIYEIEFEGVTHKVAAHDEPQAYGVVFEQLCRLEGNKWPNLDLTEDAQIRRLRGDEEIEVVEPKFLKATADALSEILPAPCYLSSSEW